MNDYKELITALKCSTKARKGKCDENCPYRTLEEIDPDFPLQVDVTINGIGYWESCDCDRMVLKAVDAIEQLVNDYEILAKMYAKVNEDLCIRTKERDAAVADLHHVLMSLGYDATIYGESVCRYCEHHNEKFGECQQDCNSTAEKWEWRGVQEVRK